MLKLEHFRFELLICIFLADVITLFTKHSVRTLFEYVGTVKPDIATQSFRVFTH